MTRGVGLSRPWGRGRRGSLGTLARSLPLERLRLVNEHVVNAHIQDVADRGEQTHVETLDVPVLTAKPVGGLLRNAQLLDGHRQVIAGHSACGEQVVYRNMHGAESSAALRLALVTECEVYFGMRTKAEVMWGEWLRTRDAFQDRCAYCGAGNVMLHKEHMVPRCRGGGDELENLVPACQPCNSAKGSLTPLEWFCVKAGLLKRTSQYRGFVELDTTPAMAYCRRCGDEVGRAIEQTDFTVCNYCWDQGWIMRTESKYPSVERLAQMVEELGKIPVTRICVARDVEAGEVIQVPPYYDKRLCREIRTVLIGTRVWERMLKELPVVESPNGIPSPLSGIPVDFSPPGWRPQGVEATRAPVPTPDGAAVPTHRAGHE